MNFMTRASLILLLSGSIANAQVPLPTPADPSNGPSRPEPTPPNTYCQRHPSDASNCGGGHQNLVCPNGTLALYCPDIGYTCNPTCN